MSTLSLIGDSARGDNDDNLPLFEAKISHGKVPTTHVSRPRLSSRITVGIRDYPLTLVSGLAGSGKSVLAASWSASSTLEWPIAWLRTDAADNRPEAFWSYVLEAVLRGGVPLPHASRCQVIDETFLAWLCADLLARSEPLVLVLDDADRLISPQILHALDFLLTHAGSRFRLLMCCRADPLLPLNRYRLEEIMTEIRGAELAFTSSEAALLLENHQLTVSADLAADLNVRTGGWPAVLGLAAIAMRASPDRKQLLTSLDVADASTAEYLMAEVLDAQTPELRTVLLQTSVATELWPDLVDELIGHPGGLKVLSAFGHANVFVDESTADSGARRVQPLLREMLQAQFCYESPELYAQLHKRCAAWLYKAGRQASAIEHAARVGDHLYAAEMMVDDFAVGRIMVADDTVRYAQALESMPTTLTAASPNLIHAALALSLGDQAASWGYLAQADASSVEGRPAEKLSAALLRATLYAEGGDADQALLASHEVDRLITPELHRTHPELRAQVAACRGTAGLWHGEFEAAEHALTHAANLARACGASLLRAQSLGRLAILHALWGQYRRAEELGHDAHRLVLQSGLDPGRHPPAAALALAWSYTQQYRDSRARHWLDYANKCAIDNQRQVLAPVAGVLRSRLESRLGPVATDGEHAFDPRTVPVVWMRELAIVQRADVNLGDGDSEVNKTTVDEFSESDSPRIRLGLNRILAADGLSRSAPSQALDGGSVPLDLQVDAWLAQCSFHLDQGEENSAVQAVERALALAAPEQLRRPFVHPPARIRELIRRRVPGDQVAWLHRQAKGGPARAATVYSGGANDRPVPPQRLSARETEVLGHLGQMLSTEEIGLAMFVSINTVRTHIRSILRKLNVPGRSAAVRRGWELGLISRVD
jgi:LuxR family maltose regulon positive regulatory protein